METWRHQVRLTPPQPGKFPTRCLGAAAIVWGKSCMAQSPEMLWSEPLSSPPFLERQIARECSQESSTGSLQASLELAWALQKPWPGLLFLLNLCLSPSGRASTLLQTSHILLVGLSQHLRGAGGPWGCSSATFSGAVGHPGQPSTGAVGAAGQSGTVGPGLQLGVKGGKRERQANCAFF